MTTKLNEWCKQIFIQHKKDKPLFVMIYTEQSKNLFVPMMNAKGFYQDYEDCIIFFHPDREYSVFAKDESYIHDYLIICDKIPSNELMQSVLTNVDWTL